MSAAPPTKKDRRLRARSSGVVVPHQPKWHQRAAAWLIYAAIRALSATLRYRWVNRAELFHGEPPGPAIYCVWHNRLALCLVAYRGYAQKRTHTPGIAGLVSASKDGGFLTGILERFRVQPVRGSSSRRGPQALLELTTWAERGYDLAITPDGPRGPCYVVQEGVMSLAQLTGLPIIPFVYNLGWKIRVKSWDRFQIPLPFSHCEMNFDNPIRVPREATDAEREALRQRLESSLRSMTRD
ncbi:MAG TPA: lysophospholipid acyltransferase family protein [Candidatus Acidoferrales bacterium]|nr:lysophospholipid acyltransferase family protein [Candidatus Acidoferrales bacterium]